MLVAHVLNTFQHPFGWMYRFYDGTSHIRIMSIRISGNRGCRINEVHILFILYPFFIIRRRAEGRSGKLETDISALPVCARVESFRFVLEPVIPFDTRDTSPAWS